MQALFLEPLEPYRGRIAPLIFEFGARGATPREFVGAAGSLSRRAAAGRFATPWRFAIASISRRAISTCLRAHGVAHVFNCVDPDAAARRTDGDPGRVHRGLHSGARAAAAGRPTKRRSRSFTPYDEVRDENPEAREALRALIRRMREERRTAYIFVNNRLEGNAPRDAFRRSSTRMKLAAASDRRCCRRSSSAAPLAILVIEAPPGAGKTTRVPPALLPLNSAK